MAREATLTIVVPAYNEAEALAVLLPEWIRFCEARGFQLLIVNDGSRDATQTVIGGFSQGDHVRFLRNKVNKGYGGAIKAGITAASSDYVMTMDADGQHSLDDVERLFREIKSSDADMVIGARPTSASGTYRRMGKWLIRKTAQLLMPLKIRDINSGMKICNTALAKRSLSLCPDSMAYSDIIALVFISQKHLVVETAITVGKRIKGESTISAGTALDTLLEIVNIVVLFNPIRIFFPLALLFIFAGATWGLPIVLLGRGVSVGAMLGIVTGIIFFFLGLLAEQVSSARKENLK